VNSLPVRESPFPRCHKPLYYMASSVSGQDELNPALWLATQAGKMELSCPLGTTRRVPQEKFPRKPYNKSLFDQACSVKMAGHWSRSFSACLWTSTPSRSINRQKKKELGQYPVILTEQAWSITHIYQTKEWCTTIHIKMSLIYMLLKSHFRMKGWTPRLALRKRLKVIRKWPIREPALITG